MTTHLHKFLLLMTLFLAGCSTEAATAPPPSQTPSLPPPSPTYPTETAVAPPTQALLPTATLQPWICSPLQGVSLTELPALVTNPYAPPPLGSDDPHQAVDFSDRSGPEQAAISGKKVHLALAGTVAAVVRDRFPYGNAIMIETRLDSLPVNLLRDAALPTPAPTLPPHPVLTCPTPNAPISLDGQTRSLYLLYAHLQAAPNFQPGDSLACGQEVGAVGDSGNALNPHLHLEARLGPAGMRWKGLAHYENRATAEEMRNYCLWRVSNLFQHLDPMILFPSSSPGQ